MDKGTKTLIFTEISIFRKKVEFPWLRAPNMPPDELWKLEIINPTWYVNNNQHSLVTIECKILK